MRNILQTGLQASGCTLVIYEGNLKDILVDDSKPDDIIALIEEFDSIDLEPSGSGIQEHYRPTVNILQQVTPEDLATTNDDTIQVLKTVAKNFILYLMRSGDVQKIGTVTLNRVNENKFDANVIGWSMPLDLIPTVQTKCNET